MSWSLSTAGAQRNTENPWGLMRCQSDNIKNPYLDQRFTAALGRWFGTEDDVCLICREDESADKMLLLRRISYLQWSSFLPAQAQIGLPIGRGGDGLSTLFHSLPAHVLQLDIRKQDWQKGASLSFHSVRPQIRIDAAVTMSINLGSDFDTYWKHRPKQLRSNVNRYRRKLEAEGLTHSISIIDCASEIVTALDRYAKMECEGWKGKAGTAIRLDTDQGQFFKDVLKRFGDTGEAVVYELYIGDTLAASRLCLVTSEMFVIMKTTYLESMARFAPGRLLLYHLVESEFKRQKTKSIEFYTNATPDQLSWSTGQRTIQDVTFFRNHLAYGAFLLYRFIKRAPEKFFQKNEKIKQGIPADNFETDVITHFKSLSKAATRVFEKAELIHPELSIQWFELLSGSATQSTLEVKVLSSRRVGAVEPAILLPVVHDQSNNGLKSLSNFYTTRYQPVFGGDTIDEGAVRSLFVELRTGKYRWQSIQLFPMDSESEEYGVVLNALREAGWIAFEYAGFSNWYLEVGNRTFKEYSDTRVPWLKNLATRKGRKFFKDGDGEIKIFTNEEGIESAIVEVQSVFDASWKEPEPYPEFVPGLIRLCAKKGTLRLGIAYYKTVPVAAQLWIVHQKTAYIYKLAYRTDAKKLSAGTLLSFRLMQHVIEQDCVDVVDYMTGDDEYKQYWMERVRTRVGVIAFDPRTVRGLSGSVKEWMARKIKGLSYGLEQRFGFSLFSSKRSR